MKKKSIKELLLSGEYDEFYERVGIVGRSWRRVWNYGLLYFVKDRDSDDWMGIDVEDEYVGMVRDEWKDVDKIEKLGLKVGVLEVLYGEVVVKKDYDYDEIKEKFLKVILRDMV
jgi:hypothetical protein